MPTSAHSADRPHWRSIPPMRYPAAYVWIVFLSALDVIFTSLAVQYGGEPRPPFDIDPSVEINPIARLLIETWGMGGASAFKFALVILAIIICEIVGRTNDRKGRRLAWFCVGVAAFPVAWSLSLFFTHHTTFFRQFIHPLMV